MNAHSTLPARTDGHSPSQGQDRREWYRTEYLQSEHWQQQRTAALKRAGNRCQVCNSGRRLNVHHRTYERLGQELPEDLTVLCRSCHELFHGQPKPRPAKRRRKPAKTAQQLPRTFVSDRDRERADQERQARIRAEQDRRDALKAEFTPNRPPVRSIPHKDNRLG